MASLDTPGPGLLLRGEREARRSASFGGLGAQGVTACLLENELASYSLSPG